MMVWLRTNVRFLLAICMILTLLYDDDGNGMCSASALNPMSHITNLISSTGSQLPEQYKNLMQNVQKEVKCGSRMQNGVRKPTDQAKEMCVKHCDANRRDTARSMNSAVRKMVLLVNSKAQNKQRPSLIKVKFVPQRSSKKSVCVADGGGDRKSFKCHCATRYDMYGSPSFRKIIGITKPKPTTSRRKSKMMVVKAKTGGGDKAAAAAKSTNVRKKPSTGGGGTASRKPVGQAKIDANTSASSGAGNVYLENLKGNFQYAKDSISHYLGRRDQLTNSSRAMMLTSGHRLQRRQFNMASIMPLLGTIGLPMLLRIIPCMLSCIPTTLWMIGLIFLIYKFFGNRLLSTPNTGDGGNYVDQQQPYDDNYDSGAENYCQDGNCH